MLTETEKMPSRNQAVELNRTKEAGKYLVILHGDGLWHVHSKGCSAGTRTIQREVVNSVSFYEGVDANDIANQIIDEEMKDMGYSLDDVKIHNCSK